MSELILVRHGQSLWNMNDVFTGWVDVPLSRLGVEEALDAGDELAEHDFDLIYISELGRAIQTAMLIMSRNQSDRIAIIQHSEGRQAEWEHIYGEEMSARTIPVFCDWRLNERYYGELQGLNKTKTREQYGEDQVQIWRRSYDTPPPKGEALQDTAARTIPFFEETILPQLQAGKNILVSAHGNSLRSIIMVLDGLSKDEVVKLEIPTGKPIYYKYDGERVIKAL